VSHNYCVSWPGGPSHRRCDGKNSGVAEGNARPACGGRYAPRPPAAPTPAAIRPPAPVALAAGYLVAGPPRRSEG
jgi:hypothetical protein